MLQNSFCSLRVSEENLVWKEKLVCLDREWESYSSSHVSLFLCWLVWHKSTETCYCWIRLLANHIWMVLHRVQRGNLGNQDHLWYVDRKKHTCVAFIVVLLVLYVLKLPVFPGWTGNERAWWFAGKTRNEGKPSILTMVCGAVFCSCTLMVFITRFLCNEHRGRRDRKENLDRWVTAAKNELIKW